MPKKTESLVSQSGSLILGNNLPIFRLGFGAMRLTGPNIWGESKNPHEARLVLRRAVELGVNFIDTADSYGPEVSENIIAETLYPYPEGLVIATKGGLVRPGPYRWEPLCRPEYLIQCVEMSLRRLKLDCIDLYQLHSVDPQVPIEDSINALKAMQKEGKIRYIGLSNVSIKEIERARKIADIVSVQNHYNIGNRQSEDVLDYCEKNQLAFIPWYPLGSGELANSEVLQKHAKNKEATPSQIALAWLLHHSTSIVPIPGTSTIAHLEENIRSAAIEFSEEEMYLLDKMK